MSISQRKTAQCGEKIRYENSSAAEDAICSMLAEKRFHVALGIDRLNPYKCPQCGKWHVGKLKLNRNKWYNRRP